MAGEQLTPGAPWRIGAAFPLAPGRTFTEKRAQTRTGLSRDSNQSLFATGHSAGKGFGASRDGAGIFER